MVIAGAVPHAIDPPLLFFPHQQVEELEAILVEIQSYLRIWRILLFKRRSTS